MSAPQRKPSNAELIEALHETRARTLDLVGDLTDDQLLGPRLSIVNPLRWEIGHLAWFQEFWMLRHLGGQPPILAHGDSLYDSARVDHDTRWDLPLLTREETLGYMRRVLDRVIEQTERSGGRLRAADGYDESYFLQLVLLHEQMHDEAITYTRQTLAYPPPRFTVSAIPSKAVAEANCLLQADGSGDAEGDAEIPGGRFMLGSGSGEDFVFDNEQWAHEIEVAPFAISKTAVKNEEFLSFVEDGGYRKRSLWTDEGWQWRESASAEHPVYWKREASGGWLRRNFDQWVLLEDRLPVIHVNWHEAQAYCRWAKRRLPTEAEWELAASAEPAVDGQGITTHKRRYPWGDNPPTRERANLAWRALEEGGCTRVDALSAGDSAFGCRQMIGNVWEWTSTTFGPYPGFAAGPYKEYSQPWFGDHKVLRGGCWVTRSRLIHNNYRNFYTPGRRDVWAGFRTCALQLD